MNIVLDAQGQAIIDSSHTRSKLLYYVCSFFVPVIVEVFFFFFGKRNRRHFLPICLELFSQFQAPLPPKFFRALISRICEFTEWDGYPGKGYSSC